MKCFSEKVFLTLDAPSDEDSKSDRQRLLDALSALGYSSVTLPLHILRQLHSVCLQGNYHITASLVYNETGWAIVSVESGNTNSSHYGIAVDYVWEYCYHQDS